MWRRRTWRLWSLLGLCIFWGALGAGAEPEGAVQEAGTAAGECLAVVVYSAITGDPEKADRSSIFRGLTQVRDSAQVRGWMGWNSGREAGPPRFRKAAWTNMEAQENCVPRIGYLRDICRIFAGLPMRYLWDFVFLQIFGGICCVGGENRAFVCNSGDEGRLGFWGGGEGRM